jgi:hypothetical protein
MSLSKYHHYLKLFIDIHFINQNWLVLLKIDLQIKREY